MFTEVGSEGSVLKKLSDEELLANYASIQSGTEQNIIFRDNTAKWSAKPDQPELSKSDLKRQSKEYGQKTETNFALLNSYRTEIESRGLKASTMEEKK